MTEMDETLSGKTLPFVFHRDNILYGLVKFKNSIFFQFFFILCIHIYPLWVDVWVYCAVIEINRLQLDGERNYLFDLLYCYYLAVKKNRNRLVSKKKKRTVAFSVAFQGL